MVASGVNRTTANSKTFQVTTPGDCEIQMTRLFAAPKQLVFDVMNKPEHVRKWWGILDDKHSVVECDIDFRVGGKWRYVGRGPHGDITFYGEYREINEPDRMVFTEIFAMFPDVVSVCTVTLVEEEKNQTRFTISVMYPSLEVRNQVVQSGMEKGAAISYDRLEEVAMDLAAKK